MTDAKGEGERPKPHTMYPCFELPPKICCAALTSGPTGDFPVFTRTGRTRRMATDARRFPLAQRN